MQTGEREIKKLAPDSAGQEEGSALGSSTSPLLDSLVLGKHVLQDRTGLTLAAVLGGLAILVLVPNLQAIQPGGPWALLAGLAVAGFHLGVVEATQRHLLELPPRGLVEGLVDWLRRIPALVGLALLIAGAAKSVVLVLQLLGPSLAGPLGALLWILMADLFLRTVGFSVHEVVLGTTSPPAALRSSFRTTGPLWVPWASLVHLLAGGAVLSFLGLLAFPLWLPVARDLGSVQLLLGFAWSGAALTVGVWLQSSWAALHLLRREGIR